MRNRRLCPKCGSYDGYGVCFGTSCRCHPSGEHPINAKCRRGIYSPPSARKATPAVRKILRFFRLRLQGVTHYTLPCKVVCQTFPLDSLKAGLAPCPSSAWRLRMEECAVTGGGSRGGIPKTPSPPSPTVTLWKITRRKKGR